MILITNSETKTDWCVVENGQPIQQISTKGINPFFQSEEEISNEIATSLLPQLKTNALDAVYFYGAGCGFPDKIAMVHRAITKHLQIKRGRSQYRYACCCSWTLPTRGRHCLYYGYRLQFLLLWWRETLFPMCPRWDSYLETKAASAVLGFKLW